MREQLYHCQNKEISEYTGNVENRFVWAEDEVFALRKLKRDLDDEQIEWDIDNFEPFLVQDDEGNIINRKKSGETYDVRLVSELQQDQSDYAYPQEK